MVKRTEKKTRFNPTKALGALVLAGIVTTAGMECSKSSSTDTLGQGKGYLLQNNPAQAKSSFGTGSPSAKYGTLLADIQDIAQSVDSIIGLVRSTAGATPSTSTSSSNAACTGSVEARCGNQTDLTGLVSNFLSTIQSDLDEISAMADGIEASPVNFELDGFPIKIPSLADPNTGKGALDIEWGTTWDVKEARVLGGAAKVIRALLNLVEAHKLSLDLSVIGGQSNPNGQKPALDLTDLVGTVRSLGIIFWSSPDLLTLATDASGDASAAVALYKTVPQLLLDSSGELVRLLVDANNNPPGDLAVNANKEPASTTDKAAYLAGTVVSWLDKNGNNQLDGGDGIHIGCWDNNADNGAGGPCFKDPVAVPASVKPAAISQGVQLLNTIKCSLDLSCTGAKVISLDDANGVLSALNQNPIPGIIAIDPGAFFTNPKPIRSYLPVWLPDSCGNVYMMAEGEVPANTDATVLAKLHNVASSDSVHFPLPGTSFPTAPASFYALGCRDYANGHATSLSSLQFQADGIFPDASTAPTDLDTVRNETILYSWFQDPSFNGAVKVCPKLLDALAGVAAQTDYSSYAGCTSASDWVTPTADAAGNQLLGKVFAWLMRDVTRRDLVGTISTGQ